MEKQFVIYAGQAFSIFAVIWWLTSQTASAITLTIASIVTFLPNILIGPFAGVWVDPIIMLVDILGTVFCHRMPSVCYHS